MLKIILYKFHLIFITALSVGVTVALPIWSRSSFYKQNSE